MIIRVSMLRVLVVAVLLTTGTAARASSILSSDARLTDPSDTLPIVEGSSTLGFADERLSLAETAGQASATELVAEVGLPGSQPLVSLTLVDPEVWVPDSPAAVTFATQNAFPLNLSDVPEPTACALLLLGLVGFLFASRLAQKV